MRHLTLISLTICTSVIVGIDALAQQPSPPPAGPAPVPYGTPITLEQAKKVAAGAEAEAKKNNWNMTIAIAEPSGSLVYLQKMDGAPYASVNVAPDKARSAAMYRNPTKAFEDRLAAGQSYILTLRGAMPVEGGLPIVVDGRMIGAIGVSGGSAQQDGIAAKAGAEALK
jgi:glc operon protein GlcG